MSLVLKLMSPANPRETGIIQPQYAIDAAALHRGDTSLLIIKEDELKLIDARRAAPVIGVGAHDCAVAGQHFLQRKWSGAVEGSANILRARLQDHELVIGQVVQKIGIGFAKRESDGIFTGRSNRFHRCQEAGNCTLRIDMPVYRPEHIVHRKRAAVMESRVITDLQRVDQAIFTDLPRRGQARHEIGGPRQFQLGSHRAHSE